MTGKARICAIMLLTMVAVTFTACFRIVESGIKMPVNPILTGGLGWGVVKDAYVRLKESPSDAARDIDHLRRGGVFALNARALKAEHKASSNSVSGDAPALWYGLTSEGVNGWVRGSELDIYESQVQAEKAASAYR
jgi:hypothetical protein